MPPNQQHNMPQQKQWQEVPRCCLACRGSSCTTLGQAVRLGQDDLQAVRLHKTTYRLYG